MMRANEVRADAAVRHAGQKYSLRIDMVRVGDGANRNHDELLGGPRPPVSIGQRRAGQDIVIVQASLPALQISVAGKARSMKADHKGISFFRAIIFRSIETVLE